jgi:hypothetical protein
MKWAEMEKVDRVGEGNEGDERERWVRKGMKGKSREREREGGREERAQHGSRLNTQDEQ